MVSSTRRRRLLERIRQRRCKNVRFGDLCWLLEAYGFVLDRIHGSHYVYTHSRLERILTVPKPHGTSEVKPVYCRQALEAIEDIIAFEDEGSDEYGE
jgi:predicted RNA binding protein YcfA (HicA-like mRNA interferase family)